MPVIKCEKISKVYKINTIPNKEYAVNALSNVSFKLNSGDRLGILGLNGSGKSTLLKILAGYIKPTSGKVYLSANPVALSHFDSLLHSDLTGIENLKLQLTLLGVKKSKHKEAIEEIIEFSELREFINHPVKTYSSGMMLRLTFSMFKVVSPEILLLDEVFSAGDAIFQKKVGSLMQHYMKNIDIIIMVSHNLQEIAEHCNKCVVLKKGEIAYIGNVSDALDKYSETNRRKKDIEVNKKINLRSCLLSENRTSFHISESIKLTIDYEKKGSGIADIVVYIRSHFQKVLTDCEIYRKDFIREDHPNGIYSVELEIPPYILNIGSYYLDLSFGDGDNDIEYFSNVVYFKIIPDEWEREKLWNINPTYPVRPILKWGKRKIISI